MKIIAVTQARIGSSRFPEKILKKIQGHTLLGIHLQRILKSKRLSKLIVATTHEKGVERILQVADIYGVECYQGSLENVLDRFYQAVKKERPDYVVRLTSDCPLIDPNLIDEVIQFAIEQDLDYCSNTLKEVFPDGQDVEVFKFEALERAWKEAKLPSEMEHVTPYLYKNSNYFGGSSFLADAFLTPRSYNHVRLTVDEPSDLVVIKELSKALGLEATWQEYAQLYLSSDISKLNSNIFRNEGYIKSLKKDKNDG